VYCFIFVSRTKAKYRFVLHEDDTDMAGAWAKLIDREPGGLHNLKKDGPWFWQAISCYEVPDSD